MEGCVADDASSKTTSDKTCVSREDDLDSLLGMNDKGANSCWGNLFNAAKTKPKLFRSAIHLDSRFI